MKKTDSHPAVMGVRAVSPTITRQGKWLIATALSLPFALLSLVEFLVF